MTDNKHLCCSLHPKSGNPNLQALSMNIQNLIRDDMQSYHDFKFKPNNKSNMSKENGTH